MPLRTERSRGGQTRWTWTELSNEETSALSQAVIEATEEAIYNSLFAAETTAGNGRVVEAVPLDRVREVLSMHGVP
ncbi:P1 family peptidase [Sorangium sp. So ce1128]